VIVESFERIHRSNLVMMGVLPLTFEDGVTWESLGLTGHETIDIPGLDDSIQSQGTIEVVATDADGNETRFNAVIRLDTPIEVEYYKNGGILQTVLRRFMSES